MTIRLALNPEEQAEEAKLQHSLSLQSQQLQGLEGSCPQSKDGTEPTCLFRATAPLCPDLPTAVAMEYLQLPHPSEGDKQKGLSKSRRVGDPTP